MSAFVTLKSYLMQIIDGGDKLTLRTKIHHIVSYWQHLNHGDKGNKHKHFALALDVVQNPGKLTAFSPELLLPVPAPSVLGRSSSMISNSSSAASSLYGTSSRPHSTGMVRHSTYPIAVPSEGLMGMNDHAFDHFNNPNTMSGQALSREASMSGMLSDTNTGTTYYTSHSESDTEDLYHDLEFNLDHKHSKRNSHSGSAHAMEAAEASASLSSLHNETTPVDAMESALAVAAAGAGHELPISPPSVQFRYNPAMFNHGSHSSHHSHHSSRSNHSILPQSGVVGGITSGNTATVLSSLHATIPTIRDNFGLEHIGGSHHGIASHHPPLYNQHSAQHAINVHHALGHPSISTSHGDTPNSSTLVSPTIIGMGKRCKLTGTVEGGATITQLVRRVSESRAPIEAVAPSPNPESNRNSEFSTTQETFAQEHQVLDIPLKGIRLDKVGLKTWMIREVEIYDLQAFFHQKSLNFVYSVTENWLTPQEKQTGMLGVTLPSNSIVSLESELLYRKAIQTCWPVDEFNQLKHIIHNTTGTGALTFMRENILVYERNSQFKIVVSFVKTIHSSGSCGFDVVPGMESFYWCNVYPHDLNDLARNSNNSGPMTFGKFLLAMFPQCMFIINKLIALEDQHLGAAVIKYRYQEGPNREHPHTGAPVAASNQYQTFGTLNTPATEVMGK